MHRLPRLAIAMLVLATGLAACGGSSSSTSTAAKTPPASTPATSTSPAPGTAAGTPSIAADPSGQLRFTKTTLTAKAGKVTIQFTNRSSVPHNLTIQQGTGGAVVGGTPTFAGGTKSLSVSLKPGTYTFYCSVPGHRAAGMQGTLVVR